MSRKCGGSLRRCSEQHSAIFMFNFHRVVCGVHRLRTVPWVGISSRNAMAPIPGTASVFVWTGCRCVSRVREVLNYK